MNILLMKSLVISAFAIIMLIAGVSDVSKGAFLAADYIASIFEMSGLKPAGDESPSGMRSYFQRVPLIRTTPGDIQSLSVSTSYGNTRSANSYLYNIDYTLQNRDVSKNISAPVVFIGYGLVDEDNGYDELKGVDVKDKIVVRLPGFPGHRDTSSVAFKKIKPPTYIWSANPIRWYRDQRVDAADDKERNRVVYTYTDTYPQWLKSCKANIEKYKMPIVLSGSPQCIGFSSGTDFASFSVAGRPFVSWFTGFHPDYHQYTDEVGKVNWTKFLYVVRLSYLNAWDIINEL